MARRKFPFPAVNQTPVVELTDNLFTYRSILIHTVVFWVVKPCSYEAKKFVPVLFFLTEHHAMKACRGSGGIVPLIL
jgi:hypothetical protein